MTTGKKASKERIYRVTFLHQAEVFEIYAREVSHGTMFGFVEIEELLFGERSQVVIDPSEDKIRNEFKDVRRTFVPLHAILRIDEVDKQGVSRVTAAEKASAVARFPSPIYSPAGEPGGK